MNKNNRRGTTQKAQAKRAGSSSNKGQGKARRLHVDFVSLDPAAAQDGTSEITGRTKNQQV
eukprot:6191157-Pleurochrysis_carterae.AAC.1